MLYDAHTHLNSPELFPKYETLLKNFLNQGWNMLVNVWVDYDRTQRGLIIAKNYPDNCLATVWFHPSETIFKKHVGYQDNWSDNSRWYQDDNKLNNHISHNLKLNSNKQIFELTNEKYQRTENIYLTWKEYLEEVEKYIRELIETQQVVAIWECGLDYHYTDKNSDKLSPETIQKQKELFILQCKLAQEYEIWLVIHSRDAFEDTIEILKDFYNLKIYFHCWGYSPKEVVIAKDLFPNLRIGFDGNITYKKADNLRESAKILELDKILLETDAPYLSPQNLRWQLNQPANVKYVYEYVAQLKNIDFKDLEQAIEENFFNFYKN